MRRKLTLLSVLVVLTLFLVELSYSLPPVRGSHSTVLVEVDPPVTVGPVGSALRVSVNISRVANLAAYEVYLRYDPMVLNGTGMDFANSVFATLPSPCTYLIVSAEVNNLQGYLAATLAELGCQFSGDGVLLEAEFSILSLSMTDLIVGGQCSDNPSGQPVKGEPDQACLVDSATYTQILHDEVNGMFDYTMPDGAVISGTLSKTITNDTTVTVSVMVANQGAMSNNFSVALKIETTIIATQVIPLEAGGQAALTFSIATKPLTCGAYRVYAEVLPLPREVEVLDNTLLVGTMTETIRGDLDGDYDVDILDVARLGAAYLSTPTSKNWNPNADFNNSLKVDIIDAAMLGANYRKTC